MGCKYVKHTDGKRYFIPDCYQGAEGGPDMCICNQIGRTRLKDSEMIEKLKRENKALKQRIKELEDETNYRKNTSRKTKTG